MASIIPRRAARTGMKLLSVEEHRELFEEAGYLDVRVIEERDKGWVGALGRRSPVPI